MLIMAFKYYLNYENCIFRCLTEKTVLELYILIVPNHSSRLNSYLFHISTE